MKQDYLSQVLPRSRPAITAAQLPGGKDIRAAGHEASAIHESLDMIRFDDSERELVGPASTPEEVELSRQYAEVADQFPSLMTLIGRPEGAMRHGYDLERALSVYRQANRGLVRVARGALLISGAALTAENDRAEDAARGLSQDARLPAERRAIIGNAARSLEDLRKAQKSAQELRRDRRARREARRQTDLLLAQKREEHVRRLAEIASAPLPEQALPAPEDKRTR